MTNHQTARRVLADQLQPSAVTFAWFRTRFLDESPEYLDDEGIHRLYQVYVKGAEMTPTECQTSLLAQTIQDVRPLAFEPPMFDYSEHERYDERERFDRAVERTKRETKEPLTRKMKRAMRRAARKGRRR